MKSIFATVTFICLTIANVASASDIVIWQQELTCDQNFKCKPVAMSIDNKNNELIILGTTKSSDTKEAYLQLWKIDPNGTVKTKMSLGHLSEYNLLISKAVSGIKVAVKPGTGDIVRLNLADVDSISLSVINRNIQVSEVKLNIPTSKISGSLILHDMKSHKNDCLLLVGQDRDGGVVMKSNLSGNIIWEKHFNTGKTVILHSLTRDSEDSSFYVAGISVSTSSAMSFTEAATVCLLRYDNKGELKASDFFKGGLAPWPSSLPKVICLPSGIVIVVYDKSPNGMATELYTRAYTKELNLLWEKLILQTKEDGPPASFDICATTDDRFVLAGQINITDLRVYEYEANGTILQSLELDGEVGVGGMYVDYLDKKILVAFTGRTQENEKEENIKLIALKPYKTN